MDDVRKLIITRVDEMETDLKAASLAMGRNHAYLQQFIWRGVPAELKERDRAKLAEFLKIPEHRLRLGYEAGERTQSSIDLEPASPQLPRPPAAYDQFALLPRYAVSASAGPGLVVDGEAVEEVMAFRRDWLRRIGANPATSGLINARGTSMEPTIPDGALMLVDTSETHPVEGCIYALARDGTLIVKRLQIVSGGLVLMSDNPAYQPERVVFTEGSDLRIAGRVRWIGRTV